MTFLNHLEPSDFPLIVEQLRDAVIEATDGQIQFGSNATYLARLHHGGQQIRAIYKPQRGERPLWDFPDGSLCRRELAAFIVSEAIGWHIVPPTVLRDGPYGPGMVQSFIDHDPNLHYFTFDDAHKSQLRRIALFDHLINNADRKGGHCLLDRAGKIWAIDHGISFHAQTKLRTVIWEFAGEQISEDLLSDVSRFAESLGSWTAQSVINKLLAKSEVRALKARTMALIRLPRYPDPGPGRQYPWPPV